MSRLDVNQARREALFASGLQQSDAPTADALTELISCTVRRLGIGGCISLMAQEFGDHPEAAAERMRWVRGLVDKAFALRASRAAHSTQTPTAPSVLAAPADGSELRAA